MTTFWDYYQKKIQPQVMLADVFFRTEQEPYDLQKVAKQFCLPEDLIKQCDTKSVSKIECVILLKNSKNLSLEHCLPDSWSLVFQSITHLHKFHTYTIWILHWWSRRHNKQDCSTVSERLLPFLFSAVDISQTQYRL